MSNLNNLKKKAFIALAIIIIIPILVKLSNPYLEFAPDIFINTYFQIIGGIIPTTFGFYLINYYWERKAGLELYDLVIPVIRNDIQSINSIINKILLIIERPPEDEDGVYKQNLDINSLQYELKNHYGNILRNFTRVGKLSDDNLVKNIELFLETLTEPMKAFEEYDISKCSPQRKDFLTLVKKIEELTNNILIKFKG